ncbi:unnamed protein product [Diamesa serratosioi]
MSEILWHTKKCCLKLFKKLSIKTIKPTERDVKVFNTKYKPHTNQSITISPIHGKIRNPKRIPMYPKEVQSRNKLSDDDQGDDFRVNSTAKHHKSYFRNYVTKHLSNNYEKQINSTNDENIVYTDNKIYISLNSNIDSSIKSSLRNTTKQLKKNRRIIYPSSGSYKGFIQDYHFNYDKDEKKNMNFSSEVDVENTFDNVVFEKVKCISRKTNSACDETYSKSSIMVLHLKSKTSYVHNKTSFIGDADEEDDLQWVSFLEDRKNCSNNKNTVSLEMNSSHSIKQTNDGVIYPTKSKYIGNNVRDLESVLDEENYDNSFNEELERRVQTQYSEQYKNVNTACVFNSI